VSQFLSGCERVGVPKEHLKIARHFNAGPICKWHQVPKGRSKEAVCRFSRPSGTNPAANVFPALKRRAIFRKSLRDCAAFVVAFILLATVGAVAQTTNGLSDAEIQGRKLAQQLCDARPAENFTNTGVLQVRVGSGKRLESSLVVKTMANSNCWEILYSATLTVDKDLFEYALSATHTLGQPNIYHSIEENFAGHFEKDLLGNKTMTPFAGSDFWIVDLGLEFFHWPGQKILKKENTRGRGCMVLESTNPEPSTNGYSRVVSWIDEESGGIVQAKAYDFNGKLLKEFAPKSFKKDVNGQWELQEMEIYNDQTRSRTRIEFDLKKKSES